MLQPRHGRRAAGSPGLGGPPDGFLAAMRAEASASIRAGVDEGLDDDVLDADDGLKAPPPRTSALPAPAPEDGKAERAIASHVLLPTRAEAEAALQRIKEAADKKAKLAEEAYDGSRCPSGKANGGNIGWFGTDETAAAFEKAAFARTVVLDVPFGPVETVHGFHVVMVHAFHPPRGGVNTRQPATAKTRDEADDEAGTGFGLALAGRQAVRYDDDGDNPLVETKPSESSEPESAAKKELPPLERIRPEDAIDAVVPVSNDSDDDAPSYRDEPQEQEPSRINESATRTLTGSLAGGALDDESESEAEEVPELDEPVEEYSSDEEIERF